VSEVSYVRYMNVSLRSLARSNVLAGLTSGRKVFGQLLGQLTSNPSEETLIFLDFTGVDVATASFLRESVIAFRDHVRTRRTVFYPVVANANATIHEELVEVIRMGGGGPIMSCRVDSAGKTTAAMVLGPLPPVQHLTFDLINRIGESDAGELMRRHEERDAQGATAWNNRLSALSALGLVVEVVQGRSKRYRPLFSGV
jgi:hypothetical protein